MASRYTHLGAAGTAQPGGANPSPSPYPGRIPHQELLSEYNKAEVLEDYRCDGCGRKGVAEPKRSAALEEEEEEEEAPLLIRKQLWLCEVPCPAPSPHPPRTLSAPSAPPSPQRAPHHPPRTALPHLKRLCLC